MSSKPFFLIARDALLGPQKANVQQNSSDHDDKPTENNLADGPTFIEGRPWHVKDFSVQDGMLFVDVQDSRNQFGTIKLPTDRIKLVQSVGSYNNPTKQLYAQVRRAPAHWNFQPSHAVLYLGEMNNDSLNKVEDKLTRNHVDLVWYQKPRPEPIGELLVKSWTPKVT